MTKLYVKQKQVEKITTSKHNLLTWTNLLGYKLLISWLKHNETTKSISHDY